MAEEEYRHDVGSLNRRLEGWGTPRRVRGFLLGVIAPLAGIAAVGAIVWGAVEGYNDPTKNEEKKDDSALVEGDTKEMPAQEPKEGRNKYDPDSDCLEIVNEDGGSTTTCNVTELLGQPMVEQLKAAQTYRELLSACGVLIAKNEDGQNFFVQKEGEAMKVSGPLMDVEDCECLPNGKLQLKIIKQERGYIDALAQVHAGKKGDVLAPSISGKGGISPRKGWADSFVPVDFLRYREGLHLIDSEDYNPETGYLSDEAWESYFNHKNIRTNGVISDRVSNLKSRYRVIYWANYNVIP